MLRDREDFVLQWTSCQLTCGCQLLNHECASSQEKCDGCRLTRNEPAMVGFYPFLGSLITILSLADGLITNI